MDLILDFGPVKTPMGDRIPRVPYEPQKIDLSKFDVEVDGAICGAPTIRIVPKKVGDDSPFSLDGEMQKAVST